MMRLAAVALVAAGSAAFSMPGQSAAQARWTEAPGGWVVELTGVQGDGCPDDFRVRTTDAFPGAPGVAGRCRRDGDRVVFEPQFPLVPGLTYDAELGGQPAIRFGLRRRATTAPTTVRIFPTSSELPENQLRLYLEFSTPMTTGMAAAHLRLLDENGQEVKGAFLQLEEELWDPGRRRLTVLFDPGRVKRGLRANVQMGAPLAAGRRYTLVVDAGWRDGTGTPIAAAKKSFTAVSADRTMPNPEDWLVTPPRAGSIDAVAVTFSEPLDFALTRRALTVVDTDGRVVPGTVDVAENERQWRFVPFEPWTTASYSVLIDRRLEDLAGNNLTRLFDADLSHHASEPVDCPVQLKFKGMT